MRWSWLKALRATVGLLVLAGLVAAFADFRGMVPASVSHALASVQFVPSMVALVTGASIALAGVLVVVVTLLVGRVYCSAVCPLGLWQDAVIRVARWAPGKRRLLTYSRGYPRLRLAFFWVCLAGIVVGWGGFTLSLLDPYSVFGRIVSGLFRPAVTLVNNALVRPGNALGIDGLYRVDAQWAGVGALALPAAMLMIVLGLSLWRGRLYCNTVCPVGTLLGLLSSRSALRLSIDKDTCRKCGDCLRACKAQCIELRSGRIDFSRCVACYNCVGVCKEGSIRYRLGWRKTNRKPALTAEIPNPQRRTFLADSASFVGALGVGFWPGRRAKPQGERLARVTTPPGAVGVERFLAHCTACQLCISACPTHVLQPAFLEYGLGGLMKPRLDYRHAFCNFECTQCGKVCPDGAIVPLALADKQVTRIGSARLDLEKCVVKTKGTDCAACSEHCPTKAVDTVPFGNNLRLPQVQETLCIGCGACEYACPVQPVKAITVAALAHHERAEKHIEKKADKPNTGGDFPF